MHRLVIAAAASVLSLAGAAHAGWSGEASGWSSGSSCGCGDYQSYGYETPGVSSYSYQSPYVDEDQGASYGYQSYDYAPYESSTYYGYGSDGGYRSAYDYGRSAYGYGQRSDDEGQYRAYDRQPHVRSYAHSYGYGRQYQAPRSYSYRDYHYVAPHYSTPHERSYRRESGHSSYDGERG